MYRFFLALLLWPCFAAYAQNGDKDTTNYNVHIKIPTAWIEKAKHFDYTRDSTQLLLEFEKMVSPRSLRANDGRENDREDRCIFNPMFVNLDGAGTNELVCFLGWDETFPYLTVFKQIDGDWYLLYLEGIHTFYDVPAISTAGNFSKNKVFYFSHVDNHGSGIYAASYSFYKLVNNKIYKCLSVLDEAHIYGWGLFMNQAVETKIGFSGARDDINIYYKFNFFPGAVKDGDCPLCANEDMPLVKGGHNVFYEWDDEGKKYKLSSPAYPDPGDLTAQKIACFGNFGNDTLFVKAFQWEISQTLKKGTLQQKKILRQYLALVKNNKQAVTQELEEKGHAGQTTFYGPKN